MNETIVRFIEWNNYGHFSRKTSHKMNGKAPRFIEWHTDLLIGNSNRQQAIA